MLNDVLCSAGEVIKHQDTKMILNEGMPTLGDPFSKGFLVIRFTVHFPEAGWIPVDKLKQLEKLLPPRQEVIIPDDAEECELTEQDMRRGSSSSGGYHHHHRGSRGFPTSDMYTHSDDEDDMQGGQRVQCASQ